MQRRSPPLSTSRSIEDLENGYGDDPAYAAETIRLTQGELNWIDRGYDRPGRAGDLRDLTLYPGAWRPPLSGACPALSVHLRRPGRELSAWPPRPRRHHPAAARAYEAAGADVLFRAEACSVSKAISTVVSSVSKPLNVVLWQKQTPYTIGELAAVWRAAGQHRRLVRPRRYLAGLANAATAGAGPRSRSSYLDGALTTAEIHKTMGDKRTGLDFAAAAALPLAYAAHRPRPRKLERILKLLGSDQPGERASAALAATRMLRSLGLEWEDILAEKPAAKVVVQRVREWDINHRDAAEARIRQLKSTTERQERQIRALRTRINHLNDRERLRRRRGRADTAHPRVTPATPGPEVA